MNMVGELSKLVRAKLGASPTPEQVVEYLYRGGAINDITMRQHVIGEQFFAAYETQRERSARDIEGEIGDRFDITPEAVRYIRLRLVRVGKVRFPGRPRKSK